jgi:hypothetical protein
MTVSDYAEAFHPAVGRCFRFVSAAGAHGQPAHCAAPPTWHGTFAAADGRRYQVEACADHHGPLEQARPLPRP